jgi:undecaprenyl diphosphate synthase
LILRIAVDYSAQWSLVEACHASRGLTHVDRDAFERQLATVNHSIPVAEVDLLIRTGGERRMSDFLLWECAYAELHFMPRLWPDFDAQDFAESLVEYSRRERRFGRIEDSACSSGRIRHG